MVLKEPFLTVSIFRWCGGLERTDVSQFLCWEGVVVLKVISNCFYCEGCGGSERTDFNSFYLRMSVVVLIKLIFHTFYFGRVGGLKN